MKQLVHIFQKAEVTLNKMVHKKRNHFLAQFSMPFHMVCSVLLQVLASKTIKKKHSGPKLHAVLCDCRNIQAGILKKSQVLQLRCK